MYFADAIMVTLNDDNAKCKRIVFETGDETLVRAALLRLNLKKEDFTLQRVVPKQKAGK